jgi:DNA (cytosine-5)-methyltransferase 1
MAAYYNENDPFAAQWLRNLIAANLIAPGDVDDRSIVDVRPDDLAGYDQCHFFAGIGGWSYAARLAGWPDNRPLWTGSCPCQPFSLAGKQKGFDDERHLWPVLRNLITERKPPVFFGEQVASATDWLGLVRCDLEEMGYAVGAIPVQAASAGADHLRDRYWFVADANDAGSQGRQLLSERSGERLAGQDGVVNMGHADSERSISREQAAEAARYGHSVDATGSSAGDVANAMRNRNGSGSADCHRSQEEAVRVDRDLPGAGASIGVDGPHEWAIGADGKARRVKPGVRLLAHGVPGRVGLLRGFGNAIDPRPASQVIGAYLDLRRAA